MVDAVLRARFLIDLQPEHIRTRVVTDHVQVELPFGDLARVEISREDFLTRIVWTSQQRSMRKRALKTASTHWIVPAHYEFRGSASGSPRT